jgi:hypothetical protein
VEQAIKSYPAKRGTLSLQSTGILKKFQRALGNRALLDRAQHPPPKSYYIRNWTKEQ